MNLRRFVTYIYRYDQGKRGKNAGFIKTDMRSDGCRMEIQARGVDRFSGKAQVYLIVRGEEPLAFDAGEMPVGVQGGRMKLFFAHNLMGDSGYTVDRVLAVVIRCGGSLLVSCWSEQVPETVLRGQFRIYGDEQESSKSDTQPEDEKAPKGLAEEAGEPQSVSDEEAGDLQSAEGMPRAAEEISQPANEEEPYILSDEGAQNLPKSEETSRYTEEIPQPMAGLYDQDGGKQAPEESLRATDMGEGEPAPPEVSFRKIDITDIRSLPKSNWHLCSNSFLIHGFFNYHYLILKTVGEGSGEVRYLGVPGIYEQPERMMATMFGFPEFEPARAGEDEGTGGVAGEIGVQGYWLCRLD